MVIAYLRHFLINCCILLAIAKSTDLTPLMTLLVGGNAICDDLTPMLECLIREITKESGAAISFEDREDVFASSPAAETIPALKAMLSTEDVRARACRYHYYYYPIICIVLLFII